MHTLTYARTNSHPHNIRTHKFNKPATNHVDSVKANVEKYELFSIKHSSGKKLESYITFYTLDISRFTRRLHNFKT